MRESTPGTTLPDNQVHVSSETDLYGALQGTTEDHLALFYDSSEERLDVALTFLHLGLERGERCVYANTEVAREVIVQGLAALGSDVEAALSDDRLEIVDAGEFYNGDGFEAEELVNSLVDAVTEATGDGFEGLCITGQIPGLGTEQVCFEELMEYEASFDATAPNFEFNALCQYDLDELTDEQVFGIMKVHPKFVYRRQLCDNPFYEDPETAADRTDPAPSARRILETAHRLTTSRGAIERREQRVGVLNRVLRHNLRNDLNVVRSHAELIAEATDESVVRDSTDAILDATDRLMEIAEGAKRVEKSVSDTGTDRVPVNLGRAIDDAAASVRDHYPEVAMMNTVPDATWVESSEELEFALSELFETLATMASDEARIVAHIDEECSTASRHCFVVECEGADIPKSEIQALARGTETQLSHGSGLGLWLVNWIVELSGGQLSFESQDDNERAIIDLVAA